MSYRRIALLALALLFASSTATAAAPPDDGGRTAARCAMFYLLMSNIPELSDKAETFIAIINDLGKAAKAQGATDDNVRQWSEEFLREASDAAKSDSRRFNQNQSQVCQSLLDSLDEPAAAGG